MAVITVIGSTVEAITLFEQSTAAKCQALHGQGMCCAPLGTVSYLPGQEKKEGKNDQSTSRRT
jgi:hypothetical protein